ncbi:NAD(P)/FAD-dependent oxidoreductase [Brevibacillus ginsengisoli]|uniref:NAD(P)/FAD-dependent oxidoreductase n=1 Tax=Brevibacillus ginsengisoli TaxID=363854 RepID=UPI003CF24B8A
MEKVQVLIIGAGMGGVSAAIWCKRLGLQAVLIEKEPHIGGQLKQIKNEIWDYPPNTFANGTALLTELRKNIDVAQLDCRLNESLEEIDSKRQVIRTSKQTYQADYVILATGVRPNTLVTLEHSSMVLPDNFSTTAQGYLLEDKRVLVIGGGDRAVESSYNLSSYTKQIWLAVRGKELRARPEWTKRLETCANVSILYQTELVGTVEDPLTRGVLLKTNGAEPHFLEVDWILQRIGVKGNLIPTDLLVRDQEGFIQVNEHQLTNQPWIYAIGDLTNGAAYASLALAAGQAMKAVKHISLRLKEI